VEALGSAVGPRRRGRNLDVIVPIDCATRHVQRFGVPEEGVVRPLASLLALHLRREVDQREHDFVERVLECPFAILKIEEDSNPRVHDLLQRVGRLDLLAPETRFLGHDQDLERGLWLERVHEPEEGRPLHELGATNTVVHVDVVLGEDPAFLRGLGLRVLDLARDGLLLVTDAVLLGGLTGVDGGDHGCL
jgi:hypothetical protein